MSRNFEQEYKEYLKQQAPDIWSRIEEGVDARIAEQPQSVKNHLRSTPGRKKRKLGRKSRYMRLAGSIAACFAALMLAVPVFRMIQSGNAQPQSAEAAIENVELENATITNTEIASNETKTQADEQHSSSSLPQAAETAKETESPQEIPTIPVEEAAAQDAAGDAGEVAEPDSPQQAAVQPQEGALGGGQYAADQPMEKAVDDSMAEAAVYENVKLHISDAVMQADGSVLYTAVIEESSYEDLEAGRTLTFKLAQAVTQTPAEGTSYTMTLHADAALAGSYVAEIK